MTEKHKFYLMLVSEKQIEITNLMIRPYFYMRVKIYFRTNSVTYIIYVT